MTYVHFLMENVFFVFNGVISLIFTFNKKYFYKKKRKKVFNVYRTSHTLFSIPIYCTHLFCAIIHILLNLRFCGICILVQNKLVQ